ANGIDILRLLLEYVEIMIRNCRNGVGQCKFGVTAGCTIKLANSRFQIRRPALAHPFGRLQEQVICCQIAGWNPRYLLSLLPGYNRLYLLGDVFCYFLLKSEDIRHFAFILSGPQVAVALRINQLDVEQYPVAYLLATPFNYVADSEFICQFGNGLRRIPVLFGGSAAHYSEILYLLKVIQRGFHQPVNKVSVGRIATIVFKGPYRNRFLHRGRRATIAGEINSHTYGND